MEVIHLGDIKNFRDFHGFLEAFSRKYDIIILIKEEAVRWQLKIL